MYKGSFFWVDKTNMDGMKNKDSLGILQLCPILRSIKFRFILEICLFFGRIKALFCFEKYKHWAFIQAFVMLYV